MACHFLIWYFFECYSDSRYIFALEPSSSLCNSFPIQLFCSFCFYILLHLHQVVGMSSCIHHLHSGRILFLLFWDVQFCLHCLTLSLYLFSLPSFTSTFLFISLSCIVCFVQSFNCLPLVLYLSVSFTHSYSPRQYTGLHNSAARQQNAPPHNASFIPVLADRNLHMLQTLSHQR